MAWRSRGITCVETGSGVRPIFAATYSSTRGSMLAKVPTAPEMAQVATSLRAITQALAATAEFGIGLRQFDAEGRRLGMDAMAAADADGVLVLEGAALEGGQQAIDIGDEQVGGAGELDVEAGVEHVRGGHALMHEAGFRPDDFGEMREEGDHIVLGDGFDLVDAGDIEYGIAALFPDLAPRLPSARRPVRPAHRLHVPRSQTRCESGIAAPRLQPFRVRE